MNLRPAWPAIAWSVFQTLECVVPTEALEVCVALEDAGWLRCQGPVCEHSHPQPLSGRKGDLPQLADFRSLLCDRRDSLCFQKKDVAVVSVLVRNLEAWKALQYY